MRTPLVPKDSLRCIPAKMDSRVFSSAHTPPSPAVLSRPILRPVSFAAQTQVRCGIREPMAAKIITLAVTGSRVVRVAGAHNSHLCRGCTCDCPALPMPFCQASRNVAAVDFGVRSRPAENVSQQAT